MKTNKIFIIAAAIFLLGIVICVAGFALSGFDFYNFRGGHVKYEEKHYDSSDTITGIKLDTSNTRLVVSLSDDENVHMTYFESDKEYYKISRDQDGMLKITLINEMKWYDYIFNFGRVNLKLEIAIPENIGGNVTLETSNGSIDISGVEAENLSLVTSNSGINAEDVTAVNSATFESSNGNLVVKDVVAGSTLRCRTSNGNIRISDSAGGDIVLDSSNGALDLEGVSASEDLTARTSNGKITLYSVGAGKEIRLYSSNASISGDIIGLMSDFSITSRTSNGRSNLPSSRQGEDKILVVETSNADISIDFKD